MDGDKKQVCIYCMGEYGIQTYFKLKKYGIAVGCFGDTDKSKQGYALEGLFCKSYEEVLELDKRETVIIVSMKNSAALVNQFRQEGFENVYSREELYALLDKKEPCVRNDLLDETEIVDLKDNLEKVFCGHPYKKTERRKSAEILLEDCVKRQGRRNLGK